MTEKLRDYFEEMVVYKDLKNNNFFSSLGLPAFLRDYLLKTFSDDYGTVDMDKVSAFVQKYIPKKEDWMSIKNRIIYENENVQILTKISVAELDWKAILPANSPTVTRMLTIATGVFTTVDVTDAVLSKKYWVAVNYVGVGRFAIAISDEIAWALNRQDLKAIQRMYQTLKQNTYQADDNRIYGRIQRDMSTDKLGLTLEETEILYNLEYQKTQNDIEQMKLPIGVEKIKTLKQEWLNEWAKYMADGFDEFVQIKGAKLHWYSLNELSERIRQLNPSETWFKLALLEAMLFEPYFPLSTEKDKKGKEIPSKKYNPINAPLVGFDEKEGDKYLQTVFADAFNLTGLVSRFRKCHNKVLKELNEVLKTTITAV